jgi:hypothetical protein
MAREQHHCPAPFDGGELLVVTRDDDLAVVGVGQGEDCGHVGQRDHAGFVDDQKRASLDQHRSPGFAVLT